MIYTTASVHIQGGSFATNGFQFLAILLRIRSAPRMTTPAISRRFIHCYHNHFSHFLDANISREMYTTSVFHSRSLTVWRSGEVALSGIRRFQHQRSERYISPQHSFHVFEICALSSIIDQNYGRNSQKAGKGEKIRGRTPFSFVIFVEISGLFTDPLEEYKA